MSPNIFVTTLESFVRVFFFFLVLQRVSILHCYNNYVNVLLITNNKGLIEAYDALSTW